MVGAICNRQTDDSCRRRRHKARSRYWWMVVSNAGRLPAMRRRLFVGVEIMIVSTRSDSPLFAVLTTPKNRQLTNQPPHYPKYLKCNRDMVLRRGQMMRRLRFLRGVRAITLVLLATNSAMRCNSSGAMDVPVGLDGDARRTPRVELFHAASTLAGIDRA